LAVFTFTLSSTHLPFAFTEGIPPSPVFFFGADTTAITSSMFFAPAFPLSLPVLLPFSYVQRLPLFLFENRKRLFFIRLLFVPSPPSVWTNLTFVRNDTLPPPPQFLGFFPFDKVVLRPHPLLRSCYSVTGDRLTFSSSYRVLPRSVPFPPEPASPFPFSRVRTSSFRFHP